MTQNSKSQRGQIFYEEYGEVGLKVPLSRKSHDFQAISAPQKSWRSSFRKFRKNLSRPEIQVRIFLSIILIFGGVLLTGYATNEVVFESGANRTLKIFWVNALMNWIESSKNKISGTLLRKEPDYKWPHKKKTTYDTESKIIKRGSDRFQITDATTWGLIEYNDKNTSGIYDVFVNVDKIKRNGVKIGVDTIHLKKPNSPKNQDVSLLQSIREGVLENLDMSGEAVLSGIEFNVGWDDETMQGVEVNVYNKELYSRLKKSRESPSNAKGEISDAVSKIEDGKISYDQMTARVPVFGRPYELELMFTFSNGSEEKEYNITLAQTRDADGKLEWNICKAYENVSFKKSSENWKFKEEQKGMDFKLYENRKLLEMKEKREVHWGEGVMTQEQSDLKRLQRLKRKEIRDQQKAILKDFNLFG